MKRQRFCSCLSLLCTVFLVLGNSIAFQSSETTIKQLQHRGRSLMSISSPEPNTALIAELDGTIHLVESNSNAKRIIWSLPSGPPIYSSYHQRRNHQTSNFYIDCGDDWELYVHSRDNSSMKLPISIQEFIETTPHVSEDGAVTLGSKMTTVFEVDPKIGRLIRTYVSSDSLSLSNGTEDESPAALAESNSNDNNADKPRLQIMRTDYTLKSFAPDSNKLSWSVTVAEIAAALLCQGVDKDFALPLPLACQTKASVFRHRSHVLLESGVLNHQNAIVSRPAPSMLPSRSDNKRNQILPLPPMEINGSNSQDKQHHRYSLTYLFGWPIALFIGVFIGLIVQRYYLLIKGKVLFDTQSRDANSKPLSPKKKRNRRSEKSNGDSEPQTKGYSRSWLDLNKLFNGGVNGQRIGKLEVSTTEIGKGSNGTIVLEGFYNGRPVAVKRLVQAHHDVALKEIQNLIASDRHSNIVRWFGVEHDQHFVYLALERCVCSLDNLIQIYSDFSNNQASRMAQEHGSETLVEHNIRLESIKNIVPNVEFRKVNGHPSPLLLKLMRDVVSGLVHLHQLGIIHRDLKPQNVLITNEVSLCAKLSDMGISKRLLGDVYSLDKQVTGCGSSGWQAPEQLLNGRQTRAVDLFSLGCILFFCITGGRHPFGDSFERDRNIANNLVDLFLLEGMPEAIDLISRLLNPDPESRPKASDVLCHPLFWDSETRLSFLRDTSDRFELEDREGHSRLLKVLESTSIVALGGKWNEKMEAAFLANITQYRRYRFDSVRDLLRVIRNKLNHYRELPKEFQELVGAVPDGFDGYFASRFPRLLIEVYKVISIHCKEEECFRKYYKSPT